MCARFSLEILQAGAVKGLKANDHQTRVQMENTSVNVTVYGLWKYKILVTKLVHHQHIA